MSKKTSLSVLILSLTERLDMASTLFKKLEKLCPFDDVEILILMDNRKQTITEKRNHLLNIAQGDYVAFLDDDDDVTDDYFKELVPICRENKYDVISFNQHCNVNGFEFDVTFDYGNPIEGVDYNFLSMNKNYKVKRPPWHICAWNTKLARTEEFINIRNQYNESSEDADWIIKLNKKVQNPYKIEKILHKYVYNSRISRSAVNN
jgi:glycosyltransferase involved in cell wall biosynthesis